MKTFTIVMLCILSACNRTPEPIQYGKEACTHCRMTIIDKRFAAEIITEKGKIFKFDAAECMAGFLKERPEIAENAKSIFLVSDFSHPGQFIDARNCFFLNDHSLTSPMGGNLGAFSSENSAKGLQKDNSARIYSWSILLKSR